MSFVILKSEDDGEHFCFACNTSGIAFGPLMYFPESGKWGTVEEFLEFLGCDPRTLEKDKLVDKFYEFISIYEVKNEKI